MKSTLVIAAALASLGALPAAAQETGAKRTPAPAPAAAQARPAAGATQQPSDAVLQEIATAAGQKAVKPEMVDRLRQALDQEGNKNPRLTAAIDSLSERVKKGDLTADDVRALHTDVVDVRFDSAFQKLEQQAAARGASAEQFDALAALLVQRSQAAQGIDLDLGAHQKRLQGAIDKLKQQYQGGSTAPADFQALRAQVAQARYDGAIKSLEQSATQGRASRADFARVRAILKDEGALAPANGMGPRLEQALAKIEERAVKGESITAAEFAQLKDQAIKSAREAAATKPATTQPPAGGTGRDGQDKDKGGEAGGGEAGKDDAGGGERGGGR